MNPIPMNRPRTSDHPQVGAGDVIAAALTSVGVQPCSACQRRKEALNAVTPSWARRLLGRLVRR